MKYFKFFALFLVLFFLTALTVTSSADMNQDLGRHIKLGEIILKTGSIPSTNLFSYTNPTFPFVNHHWLFEVISYVLFIAGGGTILILFKSLCITLAGVIIYLTATKKASLGASLFSVLLFLPLLLERPDIRPEVIGYLFFAVLTYLLYFPFKKRFVTLLIALPILALWSNIHITFVFGFALTGLIALQEALRGKLHKHEKPLLSATVVACLVVPFFNAHGLYGFLYPFLIFGNYGYPIVENQNLFFLSSATNNPTIGYIFLITIPSVIFALVLITTRKFLSAFLFVLFLGLSYYQIRHLPFFALIAVIPASEALTVIEDFCASKIKKYAHYLPYVLIFISCIGLSILSISLMNNSYYRTYDQNRTFGFGMKEDVKGASDFIKKNKLPTNIFNNFDIGGYLDYALYPTYKTYIDNRPEAFPAQFIQDWYIGMEGTPERRIAAFKKYNIHTVVVSHGDQTPWGDTFLKSILSDASFKLVYLDSFTVVLTDDVRFADIRTQPEKMQAPLQIVNDDYIRALFLMRIYMILGDNTNAEGAYRLAGMLNPTSCSYIRTKEQLESNQQLMMGSLKSVYPHCFK